MDKLKLALIEKFIERFDTKRNEILKIHSDLEMRYTMLTIFINDLLDNINVVIEAQSEEPQRSPFVISTTADGNNPL